MRFFIEDREKILEYLNDARKIKQWIEKQDNKKIPNYRSEDLEEKRIADLFQKLKFKFLRPYVRMDSEFERLMFVKEYPEIKEIIEISEWVLKKKEFVGSIKPSLENARLIKKWMEEKRTNKPPSAICNDEEERKLGNSFNNMKKFIIRPYLEKTDEEKKIYLKKHPELEEILEIIEWIENVKIPVLLQNARDIKEFVDNNNLKLPSVTSKDEEERRLGRALNHLKYKMIALYLYQDEETKINYINEHPETYEILQLLYEIDKNGRTISQRKFAEEIRKDLICHIEMYSKTCHKDPNILLDKMRINNIIKNDEEER